MIVIRPSPARLQGENMTFRLTPLFAVATLAVAACSDSTAPDSGRLSREEAIMIAGAVTSSAQTTTSAQARPAGDAIASEPHNFEHDLETSHPCPRGGTMNLTYRATGMVDPEAGSFEIDVSGTQRPAACAYDHQAVTFTVTGAPSLTFEAHLGVTNHQPSEPFTVEVNGGFRWTASDGRSGTCTIEYSEVTDFVAKRRTVDGSVCGHTVKETFTWT
jgi:hypothetical protein